MFDVGSTKRPGIQRQLPVEQLVFFALAGCLTSTVLLKVASIQYLEIVTAVQIVILAWMFAKSSFQVRLAQPVAWLDGLYLLIGAAAMVLSVFSVQQHFYIPAGTPLIRGPVWVSLSRLLELLLDVALLSYIAESVRRDRRIYLLVGGAFFWTGVLSAVYSVLSLLPVGFLQGAYGHRFRGFYNEGGPYGMYLVAVLVTGWTLVREEMQARWAILPGCALLAVTFVGSQSKAGIFLLIAIGFMTAMSVRRWWLKTSVLLLAGVSVAALLAYVNVPAQIRSYRRGAALYERLSLLHRRDGNLIAGRVAGAFIIPRMIAARPLTGVGWGHYGLVRNDPRYRGASAFVPAADLPGLGLFALLGELGIPLTLVLVAGIFTPFVYLRRTGAGLHLQLLALTQPLVHVCGGQLNLTYPWLTTGLALGLGCWEQQQRTSAMQVPPND